MVQTNKLIIKKTNKQTNKQKNPSDFKLKNNQNTLAKAEHTTNFD